MRICGFFCRKTEVDMKEEMSHGNLLLKNRSSLTLDGVSNVLSFDEDFLTLQIPDGRLSVEGQGLKIVSLCRDGGEIEISGRIDALYYSEKKEKRKEGFRFFK